VTRAFGAALGVALLGPLAALAQPPPGEEAEADPSAEARTLFAQGSTAYDQGDYAMAIEKWQAAYALDARPRILFNIAQAYDRLGRLGEAIEAFDRYLATAEPDDPNQATARARAGALRERLHSTGIRITGAPEGAHILIDGRDWGRTPRPDPIPLQPGSHRVVLRLDGYTDFEAAVVVGPGQALDVEGDMQRAPEPVDSGPPVGPIVMMASGGGIALAGGIFGIVALGKANDAPSADSSEADTAQTFAILADVGIAVGAAVFTGGLLWLLLRDGGGGGEASVAVTPVLAPTGGGAAAAVRF
jgi:hypothetical protein